MKVFIAGCARSGTSLLRGLMGSFADTYTHGGFSYDQEAGEGEFARLDRPEKHVVVKRVHSSHLTLPLLAADIALVYAVRHPLDVLTSSHPAFPLRPYYVSEARWRAEYAGYRLLRAFQPDRRISVVRYEDMVGQPDDVQARLSRELGLEIARPFSDNAGGVAISSASVEKWRRDPVLRDYLDTFDAPFREAIAMFCREFGYALPLRYRPWLPEVARAGWWRAARRELTAPRVSRLPRNPIIRPEMLPGTDGRNINGPSLIRAPSWLPGRLGKYYLYFADHRGSYIRLAYADSVAGPWRIHEPGTLRLADAPMCYDHIASPDVHVDAKRKRVVMYFHGPIPKEAGGGQRSFVALSRDGLTFKTRRDVLSGPYLRMVRHDDHWIGIDQDGGLYRSPNGVSGFVRRDQPLRFVFADVKAVHPITLRHLALHPVKGALHVYYTRRGDTPERIWRGTIALAPDWNDWRMEDERVILAPEAAWEGAELPLAASVEGAAKGLLNELRDPAVFSSRKRTLLLYSVAGEGGIAIARLSEPPRLWAAGGDDRLPNGRDLRENGGGSRPGRKRRSGGKRRARRS